jgi:type I site-specific restriction-modification system R (restriction) subunit
LGAYKFGITQTSLEDRLTNYCKNEFRFFSNEDGCGIKEYNYPFTRKDIDVLFCKEIPNVEQIEKQLAEMICGYRLKLKGQKHQFREHFIGEDKANELLVFLNSLQFEPNETRIYNIG